MLLGRLCGLKRLSHGLLYGSDSHVGFGPGFLRHYLGLHWVPSILCSFQLCWELNTQPHAGAVLPATPATASPHASSSLHTSVCSNPLPALCGERLPWYLSGEVSDLPIRNFNQLSQSFIKASQTLHFTLYVLCIQVLMGSPLAHQSYQSAPSMVSWQESALMHLRMKVLGTELQRQEPRAGAWAGEQTNNCISRQEGSTVACLPHYLHLLIEVESLRFPFSVLLLNNYIYHILGGLCLLF